MSRNRRGFRTGTRFIFGIDTKPMKFKGFKPSGNPFRGVIAMQEGGELPKFQGAGVIKKDTKIAPEQLAILQAAQKATPQPLPKPTISTNSSKQIVIPKTPQDKNLAYRNQILEQQRLQAEQDRLEHEQQVSALSAREKGTPFTFPDGNTKTWDKMNDAERGYVTGQGLRNKAKLDQNSPEPTAWYNPVAMLYDMAAGIGEAKYKSQQSGSIAPYVGAVAAPLAAGALGSIGARTIGQFITNTFNPIPIGSKQEFLDIIQTLKNNKLKNVQLTKAEEELLNSTRLVGSIANSGNLSESISLLQSLKNKANNLDDSYFENLTGFKKSEIDERIKNLQQSTSKKQNIIDEGYESGSYRPDYEPVNTGFINLQRPNRTTNDFFNNININNQLDPLPEEIILNLTENTIGSNRGRTLIPGQRNIFRAPKPESILSRIRNKIDISEKPTDMPVLESLIPSLSKHQGNNPAKEVLQAYNKVKQAEKGSSFIPSHSLSSDSYNRLSLSLIERGLKDNIINLNYHGLQPLNNLGFPTKAGIKPEIILNEINSKISNINKLTGKKYPFAELQGKDIFYPQFSVTRKQKGGAIVDPLGQWNHPYQETIVPTKDGRITMKPNPYTGEQIPYNVLGISLETGDTQLMKPNKEYKFKNSKNIYEIPLFQKGGTNPPIILTDKDDFNRRNKAYQDSLSLYNTYTKSLGDEKTFISRYPYYEKAEIKSENYGSVKPVSRYKFNADRLNKDIKENKITEYNYIRGDEDKPYSAAFFKKPVQPYKFEERKPLGYQSRIPYSNKINPVDISTPLPNLNPQPIEPPKIKPIGTWNAVWPDETGRQQSMSFENENEFNNFIQGIKDYDIHRPVTQYGQPGQADYRKEILLRRRPVMQGGGFNPEMFNENAEYNYYKKMLFEKLRSKNPEQFNLMETELMENAKNPLNQNSQARQRITEKYNITLGEDELKQTLGERFDRFNQLRNKHNYNFDYGIMEKSPEAMRQFSVNDIAIVSKPSSYQEGINIYNPTFDENGLSLETNMKGFQSFKAPSKINNSLAIKKRGGIQNPYRMQQGGISLEQAYKFLFDDEEETKAPVTAPSESELEELKQEQFLSGQKEAAKRYNKELRRMKNQQAAMSIADLPDDFESFISGTSPQDFSPTNVNRNPYSNTSPSTINTSPSTTNSSAKLKTSKEVDERAKYMMNYLQQNHNLPKYVAAAIVGNAFQESSLNPNLWGDKNTSYGLFQWRNERNKDLVNWAKQNNKNPDRLEDQLDFAVYEANKRGDLQRTIKAGNAREAAYTWAEYFEKPKVIDERRLNYAEKAMSFQVGGTYDVDIPTLLKLKRQGYKYKIL